MSTILDFVEPEIRLDLSGLSLVDPDTHDLSVKMQQLGATWNEKRSVWEVPGANLRIALALSPRLKIAGITPVVHQPLTQATLEPETKTADSASPPPRPQGEDEEIEIGHDEREDAELEQKHRQEALACVVSSLQGTLDQLLTNANESPLPLRIVVGELLAEHVTKLVSEAEYDHLPSTTERNDRSWPFLARWPVLMALFKDREQIVKVRMMQKALEEIAQEFIYTTSNEKGRKALEHTLEDALEVLRGWGQEARPCLPQIVDLLESHDHNDLSLLQAIQAIATDEDIGVIEAIIDIMDDYESEDYRERCAQVLADIGGLNTLQCLLSYIEAVYDNDSDFLHDSFYENFDDAVQGVVQSLGGEAVPLLIKALSEKVGFASQIAAAKALPGLGSAAQDALPDLVRVLANPDLQSLPHADYHPEQFFAVAYAAFAIAVIAPKEESSTLLGKTLRDALYAALLTKEALPKCHFLDGLLDDLSILVGRLAHSVGISESHAHSSVPLLLLALTLPDSFSIAFNESNVDHIKAALERITPASSQVYPQLLRIIRSEKLISNEADEEYVAARNACEWSLPFLKKALGGSKQTPEIAILVLDRLDGCPGFLQELQRDETAIRTIASTLSELYECQMAKVRVLVRIGGESAENEVRKMLEYDKNSPDLRLSVEALAGLGQEASKFSPSLQMLLGHEAELDKAIRVALQKMTAEESAQQGRPSAKSEAAKPGGGEPFEAPDEIAMFCKDIKEILARPHNTDAIVELQRQRGWSDATLLSLVRRFIVEARQQENFETAIGQWADDENVTERLAGYSLIQPGATELFVRLKRLGAKFDSRRSEWVVPSDNVDEAMSLSPKLEIVDLGIDDLQKQNGWSDEKFLVIALQFLGVVDCLDKCEEWIRKVAID